MVEPEWEGAGGELKLKLVCQCCTTCQAGSQAGRHKKLAQVRRHRRNGTSNSTWQMVATASCSCSRSWSTRSHWQKNKHV